MGHPRQAHRENLVTTGAWVALTPEQKAEVKALAASEGRTISGLVRVLLTQRLARRHRSQKQS